VLIRFAYLAVAHAFAALRLLPMSDREKDVEILALRHQLTVLQRQLGDQRHNSDPRIERSSQHSSRRWPAQLCADSGSWSAQTQCCDGIATW
jgi:hypothetical protein